MRIIEKECPNCGADLKFKNGDESVTCEYCKKEYLIENDSNDNTNPEAFNLVAKTTRGIGISIMLVSFVMIILIVVMMIVAMSNFGKNGGFNNSNNNESVEILTIDDISGETFKELHKQSELLISNTSNINFTQPQVEPFKLIGTYLFIKENGNSVYDVYKAKFKYNDGDRDVYYAVKFDNVENGQSMYGGMPVMNNENSNGGSFFGFESNESLYNSIKNKSNYVNIYATEGMYKD